MLASLGKALVRPATAVLSPFRLAWKVLIAVVLMAVPLGVVLGAYVSDKGSQIATTARERQGVAFVGPADQLLVGLVDAKASAASGGGVPTSLGTDVSATDAVSAKEGSSLGVSGAWQEARNAISSAQTASAAGQAANWSAPISAVENLIRKAADSSHLTLDPALDTNYLARALAVDLPAYLVAQSSGQPAAAHLQELQNDISKVTEVASDLNTTTQLNPLVQSLSSSQQNDISVVAQNASNLASNGITTLDQLLSNRMNALHGSQLLYQLLAIVMGVLSVWLFAGIMAKAGEATSKLVKTMEVVAAGDVTVQTDVDGKDEFGQVARHLNEALARIRESLQVISEKTETVLSSSRDLFSVSGEMTDSAESVSDKAAAVSAASEQVNTNVTVVAAAIEEMVASVKEIASNASKASEVATRASGIAALAGDNIAKLEISSIEISNVVSLITSIAEQTNLLALNATIEAARAGEMGKGFAVVANEVKDLASKTTKATEDISHRIEAIQANTSSATESVSQIRQIVEEINDIQGSIASSVEEQAAAVSEVGRSVAEAASSTSTIVDNISGVATSAKGNREMAQKNLGSAGELSTVSSELQSLIGSLLGQFHFENGKSETGTRHFVL